ncbi:MAG: histidine kinase [Acidobacteria bacterium]|nr:MAG: histidine kinase [Acidobacteriota bacterium]
MAIFLEGEAESKAMGRPDGPIYTAVAGQVTGMLPFSRMTHYPVTSRALIRTRIARVHVRNFPEMLQQIPALGPRLAGIMVDRVREYAQLNSQRDKLASLGKLSAGLAHELNNPASAGKRAAMELRRAFQGLEAAHEEFEKNDPSQEQRISLRTVEVNARNRHAEAKPKDAMEQSDREEAIGTWLDRAGVQKGWEVAPLLAEAEVTVQELQQLEKRLGSQLLGPGLRRMVGKLEVFRLAHELENSTSRISELVAAIKEYSYMDQAPNQEVDVSKGIESTLTILHHKLKQGVNVIRKYDPNLPKVFSYGSELNQVWTNLIDNAIDAMKGKGDLQILTCREQDDVLVEIVDNGTGIPAEIQPQIFDPFFTTKAVGDGTGLGLDTVYRIIRKHHGSINVSSHPGYTCFRVRLPIKNYRPEDQNRRD